MSYHSLPGGQSLDYAASKMFVFDSYEDFPVKTLVPIYDDNFEHCWGVRLPYCKSQDFHKYFTWSFSTFGYSEFEIAAAAREIWFKKESNRTMFLLKWGHR